MGKKYIIEIEDGKEGIVLCQKGIVTVGLHLENESELKPLGIQSAIPYTEPDLDQVRKEAYEKGYETAKHECEDCTKPVDNGKAYQQGLSDAWECVDKIFDMPCKQREQIFSKCDSVGVWDILRQYPASEAIMKIRQYEQEKEEQIQSGDEIETPSGLKGYVVNFTDDELVHYVSSEGRFGTMGMSAVSKTGRHFPEIAEVLQKMKETNNG